MKRLDIFLVENGICLTRSKANNLIKENNVLVDGNVINKAGFLVSGNENIEVKNICPFVSRAGLKLSGALKDFNVSIKDKIVLDIGSSTGGFTDCALQNGAKKVYSVDVGTSQLDSSLKQDKRVVVMENTDIRTLEKNKVEDINFIVCDVSFISLTKISAKISELLNAGDFMIILIKPQFECGKSEAKKHKGIIKDEKLHKSVVEQVKNDFLIHNINVLEVKKSCIQGGDGNTEFVALCQKMFTK